MNICIVVGISPPEIGGPATYVPELAKRLAEEGHDIHIVTYGSPENEEINGYFVHRVPYPKIPILQLPLRLLVAARLIIKVIKEHECVIIYVQDASMSGIPSYIASRVTRTPVVMKFVGDWAWETASSKGWTIKLLHDFYDHPEDRLLITIMKKIQKKIADQCGAIIVPSNYLKNIISKWGMRTPIHTIYNAVEIGEFKKNPKGILLTVGRLEKWKRIEDVLYVLPDITRKFPIKYVVVGEGEMLSHLKEISHSLDLNEHVEFLGKKSRKEVKEYMSMADVLILPSLYEGMSHVILEAMACKTPVIASNVCGNPELVTDKETGILVEPKSRKEIKNAIKRLLEDKKLGEVYAENALEKIKRENSWESHIEELFSIFEGVLK